MDEKNPINNKPQPTVVGRVVISLVEVTLPGGQKGVQVGGVQGFPINFMGAVQLMQAAMTQVIDHFVQARQAGKLDANMDLIQKRILTQDKNIVVPHIVPPSKLN